MRYARLHGDHVGGCSVDRDRKRAAARRITGRLEQLFTTAEAERLTVTALEGRIVVIDADTGEVLSQTKGRMKG